ncbi:MAG: hypothetical protein HZA30_05415 [Candidatus Omnitrophica bacterium]|nr:hypothetical protein [Candidatus Omnitrophota bacterium]
MKVDTKRNSVQSLSIDLEARNGDDYSLGTGYRFEDVETGKTNIVTVDATYRINEKWKVRGYERYDINNLAFQEHEYTIYRDLHCWLLEVTYNKKTERNDYTLWFVLRLKAFPDVPLGFKRTYYPPRFGSTGSSPTRY